MTTLCTPRLTLYPCRPDDAGDFVALERDPEVMRYLNGGVACDPARINPDATFLQPRGGEPHVWTARRLAGAAFVGWFCLWPEGGGLAELGYRLRRADWGQGLAAEGARSLVQWGFESAGYSRIFARTHAANRASRRVMEKLGMTLVFGDMQGSLDTSCHHEDDELEYEVTRATWGKAQPMDPPATGLGPAALRR